MALNFTAAIATPRVFVVTNVFPLVSVNLQGDSVSTTLPQAAWALFQHDMTALWRLSRE